MIELGRIFIWSMWSLKRVQLTKFDNLTESIISDSNVVNFLGFICDCDFVFSI